MISYIGAASFKQRIICSTLSGKPIKIKQIRSIEERPGLTETEVSFLQLINKITNGTIVNINETGTSVYFRPGVISGGTNLTHDCGTEKGIGYFIEALICIAPFCKKETSITLTGITNENSTISIDAFRTVVIPMLAPFGIEGIELKIIHRGAPPNGGGKVSFSCPAVKVLNPIQLIDRGQFSRIRGMAYSTRVSPQLGNRIVELARQNLSQVLGNVYIYTDHFKGREAGLSPGFGFLVVAESNTGALASAELVAQSGELPEDLAERTSNLLLEEVLKAGYADTSCQSFIALFMALCSEDVSKVLTGKLSTYTMNFLRHIRDFFGVTFRIKSVENEESLILTCVGCGFANNARKVT
eukprot:TRINITY_DN55_c3_g1_i1.p1 TRINITY_DN55_c3_g1~~TRINITY_DN55_c3_g1_i1.p1  ORF type:complete len:378 (-),score=186.31 TRINITY_DN55_c3_g1_i1:147-1214(-)